MLASVSAADADPEAGELHLAAAEHLLAVWDDRAGETGADPDDLLAGEATTARHRIARSAPQQVSQ